MHCSLPQKCVHGVKVKISAFVIAGFSDVYGGTGMLGFHELKPIIFVEPVFVVRVDINFILLFFLVVTAAPVL